MFTVNKWIIIYYHWNLIKKLYISHISFGNDNVLYKIYLWRGNIIAALLFLSAYEKTFVRKIFIHAICCVRGLALWWWLLRFHKIWSCKILKYNETIFTYKLVTIFVVRWPQSGYLVGLVLFVCEYIAVTFFTCQ